MANNSKKINENLTKTDVSKEIKLYMDTNSFKSIAGCDWKAP